jgi:hypothetical protein
MDRRGLAYQPDRSLCARRRCIGEDCVVAARRWLPRPVRSDKAFHPETLAAQNTPTLAEMARCSRAGQSEPTLGALENIQTKLWLELSVLLM